MPSHSQELEPGSIAIVGMAGRFPGSSSPAEFWNLLRDGKEATRWLTDVELRASGVADSDMQDPQYVRASLEIPGMEMFDAGFFGFSKRDAEILDPQHRHFLECAWEALEDAGHVPDSFSGAIGVFGGCGMQAYLPYNLLTNPQLVKSVGLFLLRHTGNDKDFLTTRVSYLLNLKGPSVSVQTACSTSLVAVHMASQSLLSGECDMALAGGVSIELPHRQGYLYAEGEILSPDGHCRAFDENANGTVFGSGAGVVVLRRLEDAVRDSDNIYAVIRGSAVNNDGSQKAGYLAPSVDGQARAAAEALAVAGVEPGSVSYIEAHGTGTPVGDPIEVAALTQAYGAAGQGFCGIGSLKTNIGHVDTAAGVAALMKVSLALRHGLIPASLNFSRANSRFDMARTPFYVVDKARPWVRASTPRRAAVNSLGVGGTNAHVIVEEPPQQDATAQDAGWQVVTLSARTPASLERLKTKWRDWLGQPPIGFALADAAYTTQVGRQPFEYRCAVVAADVAGLAAALAPKTHPRLVAGKAAAVTPGVVLMFPGGGAHYPGAGRELLGQPAFLQAVDECFRLMPGDAPADLRSVMFDTDASDAQACMLLEQPGYALPALFVLEYALARLWASWGVRPAALIGHSAGEYAAACIAEVMSVADALAIVVLRGRLFETAPPGAMLSVDLPPAQLRDLMVGLELDIAAVNAPDLCMASGSLAAIIQLEKRLADRGAEGRRLRINVAAHSRLLDGVLDSFRERLSRIRLHAPKIPFISNLTGTWVDGQALADPEYWVRHLRSPVRFSDGLGKLLEMPDTVFLEVGPGQGLCALARQNSTGQLRGIFASTRKAQEPNADMAVMLAAAAALWTRGAALTWAAVRGPASGRRISLPTYAFDHQRYWVEPGVSARTETVRAPAPAPAALERLAAYEDWFQVPQWTESPLTSGGTVPRRWLVLGSGSGLTAAVQEAAQREGASVTLVRAGPAFRKHGDGSYTVPPADATAVAALLQALEQGDLLPNHIVHLWAMDTPVPVGSSCGPAQTLAFDSVVYMAKALQELDISQPMSLMVVTAGAFRVGSEAVPHAERALGLGPCRVIPREMPNLRTRLVELDSLDVATDVMARTVLLESQDQGAADFVAWRGGRRWLQGLAKAPAQAPQRDQPRLRQGGVYLITGGLGSIALELAAFLASSFKARLALVSRRNLPPQASWRALAAAGGHTANAQLVRQLLALEEAGAEICAISADVADRQAMAQAVSDCRARFGALHGVFHAAGVLEDAPIAAKTAQSIQRVLAPKAWGAQILHELLPPGSLDLFAVFSSTSVYLGAPGQVDYVAANAFIDSLAASRADGLVIRWGIWGDRGMAARAYGDAVATGDVPQGGHPLLGVQVDSENGAAFESVYSAGKLWVLQEHQVAGQPVLPGTAYIELARAAMAALHPRTAIEIRALSFEEAMVFEGAVTRVVRIEMRRTGEGYDFVVRSRSAADTRWLEHARAGIVIFTGTLATAPAVPGGEWRKGEIPQKGVVAFGARWQNIARMKLAGRTAIAQMQLPQQFKKDLVEYGMHPAITDMAATFGLHLVDAEARRQNLFVPLSIGRIRLVAALPNDPVSRVELKSSTQDRFASFDVSLHTPGGDPIATFEDFSLRGIAPDALSQTPTGRARQPVNPAQSMLACGIKGQDAPEIFRRIFTGMGRDLVVTSIALPALEQALAAAVPAPARKSGGGGPVAAGEETLNRVEAAIAEVWRELLGIDEVGREDDFFALGGHSLAAVRLFARIRKQFAVDLPLATLFQASTLAGLAAVVAERGGLDTAQGVAEPKKPTSSSNVIPLLTRSWSPLVTICRGRPDRRPLFCIHGAGGNVLNFKVISDGLGPEQPFYGLQAQGVDGHLPVLTSIEEMAAQYVRAIRTVDAQGPYRLAGYSGGGVIAMEMAQQLKQAGSQIELLGLIDTLSPAAASLRISPLRKLWLAREWSLKFAVEWPQRYRRSQLMKRNYALAQEKLSRGEPLPPELVEFHLYSSFVAAQSRYVLRPYDGDVVLFRANQGYTPYLNAGKALGWDEHIEGAIHVTAITGSHVSLLSEPGISELVAGLKKHLVTPSEGPNTPRLQTVGWHDSSV